MFSTKRNHPPEQALEQSVARLAEAGPAAIDERLRQLDREWSVGRATKAFSAVLILAGSVLAATVSPWWLVLVGVAGAFLLQYLFGTCSLLGDCFHRFGFRTSAEIEQERLALRVLRGDFRHLPTVHHIEDTDAIARLEGEGGPCVEWDEERLPSHEAARQVVSATKE